MIEYIPFRLHIQRGGYKLHGFISISIHSDSSNNPSPGADGSNMFEVSNPVYICRILWLHLYSTMQFMNSLFKRKFIPYNLVREVTVVLLCRALLHQLLVVSMS